MQTRFAALFAAAGLAACAGNQVKPDDQANKQSQQPAAPVATPDKSDAQKAADYKAEGNAQLEKAMARLNEVSVFFEFDESTLTKDATDRLADVAGILVKHPDLKVKIAGHADERGTPDYNLALGQRRAIATRDYLKGLGVKDDQFEGVTSFGSEKPRDPGHNEEAWKQNRRGDIEPAESNKQ